MHRRTFPSLLVGLLVTATVYVGMPVSNAAVAAIPTAIPVVAPIPAPAYAPNYGHGWKRNKVFVINRAHSRWPVKAMAESLDNGSPLDLVMAKHCPSSIAQCMYVYSQEQVKGDAAGMTYVWKRAGYIVKAKLYLEDATGRNQTWAYRASLAIHELGHGVGMHDNSNSFSIMYWRPIGVYWLDDSDLWLMNELY